MALLPQVRQRDEAAASWGREREAHLEVAAAGLPRLQGGVEEPGRLCRRTVLWASERKGATVCGRGWMNRDADVIGLSSEKTGGRRRAGCTDCGSACHSMTCHRARKHWTTPLQPWACGMCSNAPGVRWHMVQQASAEEAATTVSGKMSAWGGWWMGAQDQDNRGEQPQTASCPGAACGGQKCGCKAAPATQGATSGCPPLSTPGWLTAATDVKVHLHFAGRWNVAAKEVCIVQCIGGFEPGRRGPLVARR